jgi:hypothetical protein
VLVAGTLAAKRISFYRPPAVASYNTRLAELDTKLSRALADQLRAAGFEFDAAIVSVQAPDCQRAVCLVKGLGRQDRRDGWPGEVSAQHVGNGTWSFAGMGQLATLQFSVDATAEMRRLAKSTPPDIPPVGLAALTPTQPKAAAASPFARECEVRLSAVAGGAQGQWLDFETARCMIEPDRDYFARPGVYLEWCRTNGVDLSAFVYPDQSYWLFLSPMAIIPVAGGLWEQATPEDLLAHPGLRVPRQFHYTAVSPARDGANTYLFRTQQGAIGILRLLEFNPASRQLKIQYKLARPGAKADTQTPAL